MGKEEHLRLRADVAGTVWGHRSWVPRAVLPSCRSRSGGLQLLRARCPGTHRSFIWALRCW